MLTSDVRTAVAAVMPHAGYTYSGPVAAHGYYQLSLQPDPDTVVLIGPNHTGVGAAVAMEDRGFWETPLGTVEIDAGLAQAIQAEAPLVQVDYSAHAGEHSIEVQVPFLQIIFPRFKIVPIVMLSQDLGTSREVGEGIARACKGREALVISSSDLTHYESQRSAERKDRLVLKAMETLDEDLLVNTVYRHGISMCGYGPVAASICAAKAMGASHGRILKYSTSGNVTSDFRQVVGYASVLFER